MKTTETVNAIRDASLVAYFILKRTLDRDTELLDEYVNDEIVNGNNNPDNTVKRFASAIGRREAETVIATLINGKAWDGRISKVNAEWAASCEEAFDEKAGNALRISTEIHPTHLDAIATAMREYK